MQHTEEKKLELYMQNLKNSPTQLTPAVKKVAEALRILEAPVRLLLKKVPSALLTGTGVRVSC